MVGGLGKRDVKNRTRDQIFSARDHRLARAYSSEPMVFPPQECVRPTIRTLEENQAVSPAFRVESDRCAISETVRSAQLFVFVVANLIEKMSIVSWQPTIEIALDLKQT
jgi:hypothetical protein